MTLSERIMTLRRQKGWSQEELADRLDISRQSVSKWESGASTPDLDKIIRLSQLFGVTTDYLLLDTELPAVAEPTPEPDAAARFVSQAEAETYLAIAQRSAKPLAAAIAALVLSPGPLILLSGITDSYPAVLGEGAAAGIGVAALLMVVAVAVGVLIRFGMDLSRYEFLEKEPIQLQSGVAAYVHQLQEGFSGTFRTSVTAGVVLCILGVIPLIVAAAFEAPALLCIICVDVLLLFVSCAVGLFVWSGSIQGSHKKLLQEDDYTVREKKINNRLSPLAGCYWLVATAIYLAASFLTNRWDMTWILWPCAGVLFAAIWTVASYRLKKEL